MSWKKPENLGQKLKNQGRSLKLGAADRGAIQGQVQGQTTENALATELTGRMTFFFMSKSAQTLWANVVVLSVTLTYDLQVQIQGQTTGNTLDKRRQKQQQQQWQPGSSGTDRARPMFADDRDRTYKIMRI